MKEIRKLKDNEIDKKLSEINLELGKELGNVKMGRPVKNPGRIRQLRKTAARILTLRNEKKKQSSKKI